MRCRVLPRRRFLKTTAVAVAAGPALSCGGSRSPWRFFSEAEAAIVNAVCERLIPADQDPGAAWAGVVKYIDRQLTRHFKKHQTDYRAGIAALDRTARSLHGVPFLELSAPRQDEVLASLERDEAPAGVWTGIRPRQFFELVLAHTMQGFYGSPRHGGNRDAVSWRMLGVPDPPLRGRLQYEFKPRS
jgi:gluconate 2-dehydrogenase gamma chain